MYQSTLCTLDICLVVVIICLVLVSFNSGLLERLLPRLDAAGGLFHLLFSVSVQTSKS